MGWNLQFSTKTFVETPEAVATEFFSVFTVEKCGRAAEVDFNINKLRAAEDEYGIPACDFVTPTSEQAKEWENFGDLWLYMNEMIEKFITGAEPLSGWDAYVAKCDELGLSRALEIKQDQYDAYVAIIEGLK